MKHSLFKNTPFLLSDLCYILWSLYIFIIMSIMASQVLEASRIQVGRSHLWFHCSTFSLRGPPPPTPRSSPPSRERMRRPGTPTQPTSINITQKNKLSIRASRFPIEKKRKAITYLTFPASVLHMCSSEAKAGRHKNRHSL